VSDPETLFVSCNPAEGPVSRFGSRGDIIGGVRNSREPKTIKFQPDEVVMIPAAEAPKYREEYRGALESGALKRRTAEDHAAWEKAQEDYYVKLAEEAEKKRKASAEEAKKKADAEEAAAKLSAESATGNESESNEP
jgi:hypothetical protein